MYIYISKTLKPLNNVLFCGNKNINNTFFGLSDISLFTQLSQALRK